MTDKKLSEFSSVLQADVSDLVVLYLDANNTKKNGLFNFQTFSSALPRLSSNNTFSGSNTFSGTTTFTGNTTFNNTINANISGSSSSCTGNAATVTNGVYTTGAQTISGVKTFSGLCFFTGGLTCSSSVSLGSSVTAATQPSTDTTFKVATTEFCQTLFSNAIGTPRDVTTIWGDGTPVGSPVKIEFSEDFTNFEQIGVVITSDNGQAKTVFIQSTYWLNYSLNEITGNYGVLLAQTVNSGIWIFGYNNPTKPSSKMIFNVAQENCIIYRIFGINRKVKTVPDPIE